MFAFLWKKAVPHCASVNTWKAVKIASYKRLCNACIVDVDAHSLFFFFKL